VGGKYQEDRENYVMRKQIFILYTNFGIGESGRNMTDVENRRNFYTNIPRRPKVERPRHRSEVSIKMPHR
jgi:hypothetical protein